MGKEASHASGPQTLRDATPGVVDEYLRAIRSHLPVLFLDTSTAHLRGYHRYPITLIPALAELAHGHYRPIALVDGVTVYKLNSPG